MATAKYLALSDELQAAIKAGGTVLGVELVDGAKLPTEPELAAHFQMGRGTVRQALSRLAAEGLIETRGRAGTFVRRLPVLEYNVDAENPHRKDVESVSDTWTSVVEKAGHRASQKFSFRIEPASSSVAQRLGVDMNNLVVVRELLRFVNDVPWSEQSTYYPHDIATECGLDIPSDIPEGTVRRMATHGYVETRVCHEITGRPATNEEREMFDLAPGVSVLVFQRVGLSKDKVTRLTVEILPADRNAITHVTERSK